MGFTKVDKAKFLSTCDTIRGIMPKEVIEKQGNLFGDVLEFEGNNKRNYAKLRFTIKYPPLDDNPDGNPIAKQSARFTAKRHLQDDAYGNKKGDVIVFTNKHNKRDVMIVSYPEAKIVNTEAMIAEQIKMQLLKYFPEFNKFIGCVFLTRLEMVFKHPSTAPQYMLNDLKSGTKIYFKDTKPDLDNLEKLVYDALQGMLYENDARIVSKNGIFKRYGIIPGIIIELEGEI